jgi:hypothetical protein
LIGAWLELVCGGALADPWVNFVPVVEAGKSSNTVNFGGHQWIIVGTDDESMGAYDEDVFDYYYIDYAISDGGGIQSDSGTVTLLLKDGDSGFDKTLFRDWNDGNYTVGRTDYKNSALQGAMKTLSENFKENNAEEWNAIKERTLEAEGAPVPSNNQLSGGSVEGQRFWALSIVEWAQLTNDRAYAKVGDPSSAWWLRSPGSASSRSSACRGAPTRTMPTSLFRWPFAPL